MTSAITQRNYRIGDLDGFTAAPGQAFERLALQRARPRGRAMSFLVHGRVIAVGGLEPVWPLDHVAEAWAVVGRHCRRADLARLIKWGPGWISAEAKHAGFTRVEARARLDLTGACATLERMGFVREGLHLRGGPHGVNVRSYAMMIGGEP